MLFRSTNPDCTRLYVRKGNTYGVNVSKSQESIAARLRFSAVGQAVAIRSKDLTKIAADRAAFLEQKDQPGGKKTMKAWYWKVEGQAYDQQHG